MLLIPWMHKGIIWGAQMEELDNCRAEGVLSDPHVYGDEKTT
jgi:hypothetical protein